MVMGAINLYLVYSHPILETMQDATSTLSPSEISPARFYFLIFCCFNIPIGWLLANAFLYLYFKCDEGYFSVANLQFKYNKNVSVGTSLADHLGNCLKKCDTQDNPVGPTEETNMQIENEVQGIWVDLSGEQLSDDEWSVEDLNESDTEVFKTIECSFPSYKDH
jgi:hypothetical protein